MPRATALRALPALAIVVALAACGADRGAGTAAADSNIPHGEKQQLYHDPQGQFGPP